MSSFTKDIVIAAPVEAVGSVLGDIGTIADWNPGVRKSYLVGDDTGLGSRRRCELGAKMYLDEEVVEWEALRRLTMRITATNLPFKTADIRFTLDPVDGGTRVAVSPVYSLKFGPLGALMDRLMVRRSYAKGMEDLLIGLKSAVEGGGGRH